MIDVEVCGGTTVLRIGAFLDARAASKIAAFTLATERTPGRRTIVSLERCDGVDEHGLTVLLLAWITLGPRLSVVVAPGSRCAEALANARMDRLSFLRWSVADTLREFRPSA